MSSNDMNKLKRQTSMSSSEGIVINFKKNSMINMSDELNEINEQDVSDNNSAKQNKIPGEYKHSTEKNSIESKKNKQINLFHLNSRCDVYIELEELNTNEDKVFYNSINEELSNYEWRIINRWIKYEQKIDLETNIWSKPYIGALIYQNLIYLKNTLQYGTIILNSKQETFQDIVDEVVQDFINRGHMNRDHKERLKNIILNQHRSHLTLAGALCGKKAYASQIIMPNRKHSKYNSIHSFLGETMGSSHLKKNLSHNFKHQGSKNEELVHLSDANLDENSKNPVKFYFPSSSTEAHMNEPLHHSKHMKSTLASLKSALVHSHSKTSTGLMSGQVEAVTILVGAVDFLDRPVMGLVRISTDQYIEHLIEFQVKVRFLFIFLGPKKSNIDYYEIGRCMGTLMTNKEFHECAYNAKTRQQLIKGITNFSNRNLCMVLPVEDYDDDLLIPIVDWVKKCMNKQMLRSPAKKLDNTKSQFPITFNPKALTKNESIISEREVEKEKFDPFKRTGCLFGSTVNEIKRRYRKYFSDIRDGLNIHCLVAFIFIFTVCLAPALCFGGILADKSDQWFGINEMLLATSLNGIIFGLFSGQPLMIFGATGPFLVFEELLYIFCIKYFCIEFLATRIWVALWVLFFVLLLLAFEGVFIIHFVTRFTEEIFAFLIALVFLADAIKKIIYYFKQDPIYVGEKYCEFYTNQTLDGNQTFDYYSLNSTNKYTCYHHDSHNLYKNPPQPNIALISLMLLIGTCTLALFLKKLRRSNFFGSYIRRTLSDVGILISIVLMVFVDFLIRSKTNINTQKLEIPQMLIPSKSIRSSWFVNPMGNNYESEIQLPIWVPFAAVLPAFIIFIVLFFEVELTGIILSAKHRKLKKGTGFNFDLLLGALMMTLNAFLGLPFLCSAPVRTLAHWASLTIYSSSFIPGEKPKLQSVIEQRVTGILVHIAIGLCLKAKFLLKLIPIPVLFGVFLYFGIVSLSGTQLFERIKLIFTPFKYCPNEPYAVGIRPTKRNVFTLVQIVSVLILLGLKSFVNFSFLFPIFLVFLVPFRKFILPHFFTNRELEQLDDETEHQEDDIVHDFYELTHLPI